MYGRILGLSPQAGGNRVGSNPIDLPENDFGLLAAIGPVLRQFSVASRLACVSMTSASAYELALPTAADGLLRTPVLAVDVESSTPLGGGDQLDQNAMSVEEAYVGDVAALTRLNERYRLPTIIVAIVEGDKDAGTLTVGGYRYDTQTGARSEIAKVPVQDAGQLADAAKQMHAKLHEQWRGMAVVRRDAQDTLDVFVPIRALGDWVQVRQRLGGVPAIKSVAVRSLEADRADLRLEYFGTPEELQRTLAQVGLTLDKDADKWRLQAR